MKLTGEQEKLIKSNAKYIKIIALAGAGKSSSLVAKIMDMIDKGSDIRRVLICCFTNRAANDIKNKINVKLSEKNMTVPMTDLWVGTIHSMCVRLLRLYGIYIGLDKFFGIANSYKQQKILKDILSRFNIAESEVVNYSYKISFIKNRFLTFDNVKEFRDSPQLKEIFNQYNEGLKKNRLIDFDDILLFTHKLLENEFVLSKVRYMFDTVVVDEFQDVNLVQYEIFKKIVLAPHIRYIVVGDDDQSIYGFRGSNSDYLSLNFDKDFIGTDVIHFTMNFRCPQNIVSLSEQIIKGVENRAPKLLRSNVASQKEIPFVIYIDPVAEARGVIDEIMKLNRMNIKEEYDKCAILYRTQRQSRVLEEFCVRNRIPYRVLKDLSFFDRAEVRDTLAFIGLIFGITSNENIERIINVPARGVGEKSLQKLRNINENLWDTLLYRHQLKFVTGKLKNGLDEFMSLINKYKVKEGDTPDIICENIMNYIKEINYIDLVYPADSEEKRLNRKGNIEELLSALKSYIVDDNKDIEGFFDYVREMNKDDDQHGVNLMTMHASKGLEYENVFLVGLQDGLMPHGHNMQTTEGLNEERKLLYVAITRSKKRLYLSSNNGPSNIKGAMPCRFFDFDRVEEYIDIEENYSSYDDKW